MRTVELVFPVGKLGGEFTLPSFVPVVFYMLILNTGQLLLVISK